MVRQWIFDIILNQRFAVLLIGVASTIIIATALAFEHIGGYVPCDLCLLQRKPYYIGAPIAMILGFFILIGNIPPKIVKQLLFAFGILFVISFCLGMYHSGVEWNFWAGPSGCSGTGVDSSQDALNNLLGALETTRVVPCDEANWRFLGLSFAGYNALISIILAAYSFICLRRA